MDDNYVEDPYGYSGGTNSNTPYLPPTYVEDPYGYTGGTENTGTTYLPPNYVEDPYGYTGGTESTSAPYQVPSWLSRLLTSVGGRAVDYVSNNPGQVGLMAALAALGALSKAPPSGGGTTKRYKGPAQPLTRTVTQGRYGPIAQYAAQGGIMHAYANGGQVRPFPMQDGGFVMTKKAVDGAGGQGGLRSIIPEAQPIRGPGHGTSDSIPAYIQGPNGQTPAKVSNGESYVPPGRNTREMYALMKYLEGMGRRA